MHLETWDRTQPQEQENTAGRYKESGAPFGKKNEFDEVDLSPLTSWISHVRLAKEGSANFATLLFLPLMGLIRKRGSLMQDCFLLLFVRIQTAL